MRCERRDVCSRSPIHIPNLLQQQRARVHLAIEAIRGEDTKKKVDLSRLLGMNFLLGSYYTEVRGNSKGQQGRLLF